MGWQDRSYYRDRPTASGPLWWLMNGSVPLFTVFNIRVRAHASLIVVIGLALLLGLSKNDTITMRVQSMTALFLIVLLHEFGHCFAARWTGGDANDILMTPLGGIAMAMSRRKPWPTFVTVAGGPAVNVVICLLCAVAIWGMGFGFPWTPFTTLRVSAHAMSWFQIYGYVYWLYAMSFALLMFNILPVYFLDGGQLLQSILWKPLGYYRSMMLTMNIGIIGSIIMAAIGIATLGSVGGGLLLIFIAFSCLMTCIRTRTMLLAEGPWGFPEEDAPDFGNVYAAAYEKPGSAAKRVAKTQQRRDDRVAKRAAKIAADEADEQRSIDQILAKVSAQGMQSLTSAEQKTLRSATERQRSRDAEKRAMRK